MKYYSPRNLDEYFEQVLLFNPGEFSVFSGGTDLVPRFEQGMELPDHLIDIKQISELAGIVEHPNKIEIGALTTIEELRKSSLIRSECKALWMATSDFAGTQIRNRATLGGNICNSSPAGDTLPPLYAFHAEVKVTNAESIRCIPIREFILGPGRTDLKPGELLHSVIIPKQKNQSVFYKLGLRNAMAISVVNFAIVYKLTDGNFTELTIATGAVAPTVVYLNRLAEVLRKKALLDNKVIDLVDKEISPISDIRGTATYRRTVLKNLLRYHLAEIVNNREIHV